MPGPPQSSHGSVTCPFARSPSIQVISQPALFSVRPMLLIRAEDDPLFDKATALLLPSQLQSCLEALRARGQYLEVISAYQHLNGQPPEHIVRQPHQSCADPAPLRVDATPNVPALLRYTSPSPSSAMQGTPAPPCNTRRTLSKLAMMGNNSLFSVPNSSKSALFSLARDAYLVQALDSVVDPDAMGTIILDHTLLPAASSSTNTARQGSDRTP